jgi:transcriptional regulator with XRE-family HTH domain
MAKKEEVATSFGRYLRSLRLSRDFDNINDYVRHYKVPITASYYRDLEHGRRTLDINSVEQISAALQADLHEFMYYFLEDMIPKAVLEQLNVPPSLQSQSLSAKVIDDPSQRTIRASEDSLFANQPAQLHNEIAKIFESDIEFFNLLLFIYESSTNGVTKAQIKKFMQNRPMNISIDEALNTLVKHKLIEVNDNANSDNVKILPLRKSVYFQGHSNLNKLWFFSQLDESIAEKYEQSPASAGTPVKFGMAGVRRSQIDGLIKVLANCAQTVYDLQTYPSKEDPICFFSVKVSLRPEYK